jgi:hypothetical protein
MSQKIKIDIDLSSIQDKIVRVDEKITLNRKTSENKDKNIQE